MVRRLTDMRLATLALAAAAATAGGSFLARPAESRPVQIDPIAQLRAENARLRADLGSTQAAYRELSDGLDRVQRVNQRNRDRMSRRMIDRMIIDARDRAEQTLDSDPGHPWGERDHDHRDDRPDNRIDRPDTHPDNRPDRDHGPGVSLMSPADFEQLRAHVAGANFDSNKLDLVRSVAQTAVFSVDQVVALMQTTSFDETRIEIAVALRPRIVDPERWYLAFDALTFSASRDTLRQRLGQ